MRGRMRQRQGSWARFEVVEPQRHEVHNRLFSSFFPRADLLAFSAVLVPPCSASLLHRMGCSLIGAHT